MGLVHKIEFKNFEQADIEVNVEDMDISAAFISLQGGENPCILESVENDDDKTRVIKGRKLLISFNSQTYTDAPNVDNFSDGDDDRFLASIDIPAIPFSPFIGNLVLDDNTEAFQPRPNPVRLFAGEGLGSLKDIELTESDGDITVGHYRVIDYIYLCLRNLIPNQSIHVAMNLCEIDGLRELSVNFAITAANMFRIPYEHLGFLQVGDVIEVTDSASNDGTYTITTITPNAPTSIDIVVSTSTFVLETSEAFIFRQAYHAFFDTMLEATTFETDANKRDNCYNVLNKILDAFGCFITYHGAWYIIRWDEYDLITTGATTLRFANFSDEGIFQDYENIDVDKIVAHDGDALYEGYRLSMDNAVKRFQRRCKSVTHIYKFQQPKEVPCNSGFLRGTVDDDVLPLKTYVPDCWTLRNGVPGSYGSTTSEMRIGVRFDDNEYETERYLYLTPTTTSQLFEYAESEGIPVRAKGKLEASVNWRTESLYPSAYGGLYSRMVIYLNGDDGSDWLLGNTTLTDPTTPLKWWDTSNFTVNTSAGHIDIDSTLIEEQEWQQQTIEETPEIPVDGKIYIWLHQGNQSGATTDDDGIAIDYADLRFTYFAYINGTYHTITAQENKVTGDNASRKNIEHEMFIGDSPEPIFKGALKKFTGSDYVLTEGWNYYHDRTVLPGATLAKHIVFQWWNQFRKTRTVIETDIQGLRTTVADGTPGLIHRWKIIHGDQEDKKFMLTSFRNMDFRLCGWNGVFVETSDADGDRNYDDTHTFKYIQE